MPSKYLLLRNPLTMLCLEKCSEQARAALPSRDWSDFDTRGESLFGSWLRCYFLSRSDAVVFCAVVLMFRNTYPRIDACRFSGGALLLVPKRRVKRETQDWGL